MIKICKLTPIPQQLLQILFKFCQLSHYLLKQQKIFFSWSRIQSRITYCDIFLVFFNLEKSFILCFSWVWLLKSKGQLLCRLSLNLGLFDVSIFLLYILGRNPQEGCFILFSTCYQDTYNNCPKTGSTVK